MTSVIINAILVGIAVWLATEFWHTTGIGLVLLSVLLYVVVRFGFGLAMMLLGKLAGRPPRDSLFWV